MSDDQFFRIALIGGFLVVLPIGFYYRLRSQSTGEPLDRRQEGLFILFTLRALGLLFMATLIAYARDPGYLAWSAVALPLPLRWLGLAVFVAAAALLLWTLRTLGPNLTDTVVTRRAHTLVVGGPYRFVRHPFYASVGLLAAGVSLAAASWFVAVIGLTFLTLIAVRTRIEEQKLLERFGDAYRDYMRATGRFWPKAKA